MSAPVIAPTGAPIDGHVAQHGTLRVALVGNPNTGKTTLFNALTGMRQRVANFAGVTVERVEGSYRGPDGRRVAVLDLPGCYSLAPHTPDEAIALDVLLGRAADVPLPDVIVVVVDAQNLERNLFLVSQLLELSRPLVVALNQADAADADGIRIDIVELINELGVTVIPTVATKGHGIDRLRHAIARAQTLPLPRRKFALPVVIAKALAPVEDEPALETRNSKLETLLDHSRAALTAAGLNPASLDAELRYRWITGVVQRTVTHD